VNARLLLLGLLFTLTAWGQTSTFENRLYVADIELQTELEFQQLLSRAEQLFLAGNVNSQDGGKVTFVLHGPVLKTLLRTNYLDNRKLVDLAASLTAMEVIELKACNSWMMNHEIEAADLQPFVQSVDYGPEVVKRLLQKNYLYF